MMHIKALDDLSEDPASLESGLLPVFPLARHPVRPAQLFDCMGRYHVPGASIAVIADHRLEWASCYGVCGAGRSKPVTPDTLFQACPVSKPVTAMAALELVQEGLLGLDEDVNSYLVSWKVPTNRTGQSPVTRPFPLSTGQRHHLFAAGLRFASAGMRGNFGRELLFLVLLILLVGCSSASLPPTPAPTTSSTAWPAATLTSGNGGGSGRIALACAPDVALADVDICVSNLDGSDMHRLTNGPGPELSPSWSPDGKRLIYRYTPDPNQFELSDIWIMNADGSGKTNLTRDRQGNWGATWSPDGKHILFNSGRDGSAPQLYIMNPDGTGLHHLLSGMWGEYPDWSPDGKKIAFMSNIGTDSFVLYVMNADGSGITRVTNGPREDSGPRWSRDGKKIAFTSNRTGHTEVYVMNADGSGLHRLTTSPPGSSSGGPDWSPDGTKILFLRSLPKSGENWIMNSDGSAQTKLSDTYGFGDAPVWQPKADH